MCLDCGCEKPNDDHGDKRHFTMNQLVEAARASEISTLEAAQNIVNYVQRNAGSAGQTGQQQGTAASQD